MVAVQLNKVAIAPKPTQGDNSYWRDTLIKLLSINGFLGSKTRGYMRFSHRNAAVRIRIYQNYVAVIEKPGGYHPNMFWFWIYDVSGILAKIDEFGWDEPEKKAAD